MKQWKSIAWGGLAVTWGIMGGVATHSSQQEDPALEVDEPPLQDSLTSPTDGKTPEVSPSVPPPEASATSPWISPQSRFNALPQGARAGIPPAPPILRRRAPVAAVATPVSPPVTAATTAPEIPIAPPIAPPAALPTAPPIATVYVTRAITPVPSGPPSAAIAPELENTAPSSEARETGAREAARDADTEDTEAREATAATPLNQLAAQDRQRATSLVVGTACIPQKLTPLVPENLAGAGIQPTFSRSLAVKGLPTGDVLPLRNLSLLNQERPPLLGSLSYRSPAKGGCPQDRVLATARL